MAAAHVTYAWLAPWAWILTKRPSKQSAPGASNRDAKVASRSLSRSRWRAGRCPGRCGSELPVVLAPAFSQFFVPPLTFDLLLRPHYILVVRESRPLTGRSCLTARPKAGPKAVGHRRTKPVGGM